VRVRPIPPSVQPVQPVQAQGKGVECLEFEEDVPGRRLDGAAPLVHDQGPGQARLGLELRPESDALDDLDDDFTTDPFGASTVSKGEPGKLGGSILDALRLTDELFGLEAEDEMGAALLAQIRGSERAEEEWKRTAADSAAQRAPQAHSSNVEG
jgi:hypothetical protein